MFYVLHKAQSNDLLLRGCTIYTSAELGRGNHILR